ncbi:branched-chain amino acid ABC transporter permease [Agrobacterium sp. SHOUNA12C]|uniref:branched-chain amino acid ABC transporter permease n=1 Tax=Rhizobium rhizogenes TaxID=359 RepID=UPI00157214D3|nr:branched-chain amino acid ABC transporter permease [Rhizobium rhizogenes]MCJ9721438.1 branched-chain amino acid ABC transporter permease [Agrobacterium sp. BETTINA12B]MCJ9756068.1 branched-chain amino acid ABC transporter permease [Agrobacterium sp. SHOUNA12C]NTF64737.1 branched-chain amino acid ABC transporter permease [Rhizobium rhizogenes]NTG96085.1 branched-chain amino acid ABC transporter permease [Rhizobium rhizogenes]NTI38002.1 branched-chain amino acid ABC transporter permease [Rhiz
MTTFFQLLVSGLATGSIYALAAIGFTLLWQASQTINFAQGEFIMLPAFFVLAATHVFGLSFPIAIVVALALTLLLLGFGFKRIVVDPLLSHGVLPIVIATIALGILMKEGVKQFYSAEAQPFPALFPDTTLNVFGAAVSVQDIAVLVIALGAVLLLQFFMNGTKTGRAMQATAQNPQVAEILGVPIKRMILYTFLINAALALLASILISPIYLAKFSNGETLGLIAFIAAIVGGFNQIKGAIVGGLLIGVVDNLSAAYVSASYRSAIPLILLIVIILVRPQGLLGKAEGRTI